MPAGINYRTATLVAAISLILSACVQPTPRGTEPAATAEIKASAPDIGEISTSVVHDEAQYKRYLEAISHDYFEGRGAGAVGEKRFVPWLVQQFKDIGLSPGNGDSYLQNVPMLELTGSIKAPLSFTRTASGGQSQTTTLVPGEDFILSSHIAAPEVSLSGSEMIFMGYGVNQPSEQWNDYAGVDVKGKTVVVLINDPGFHEGNAGLFNGKAMTYAGRWTYKFEEAARQGAAACIIIHDIAGASYGWDVLKNGWGRPEFELPKQAGAISPLTAQGWITEASAKALLSNAGFDLETLRTAANQRGFKPVALNMKASAVISNKIRSTQSQNVAALIRGTKNPEEVVIYTAHWDHLGRNFQLPVDGIYNGAIDNGTGVAALLEMARVLQKSPPERSVLMLAVTLEESGLLGSRFYAENPLFPLNQTVANLNMDALPLIGPSKEVVVIGFGNSRLEDLLALFVKAQNRKLVPEPTPENGFYFRSDHFNFAKVGVPALYIKSGPDHLEKGVEYGTAWMAAYNKDRYHKPSDEFDPSADYRGVMQDMELMLMMGAVLANGRAFPGWYESSEFHAIRAKNPPKASVQ